MRLIDATRIEQYILNNCSYNEEINAIYAEIINAPTVDAVERKKGKWLYADDVFEDAVCSSCKWDSGETMQHARKTFKFCPNCGAEMLKGEEE